MIKIKKDLQYTKGDTFKLDLTSVTDFNVGDIIKFEVAKNDTTDDTVFNQITTVTSTVNDWQTITANLSSIDYGLYIYRITITQNGVITTEISGNFDVTWYASSSTPNAATVADAQSIIKIAKETVNKASKYDSFITVSNGVWDYKISDKIKLTTTNLTQINNVTDGSVGIIYTDFDLDLPSNSTISFDYNYIDLGDNQSYIYTFLHVDDTFMWCRTVVDNA